MHHRRHVARVLCTRKTPVYDHLSLRERGLETRRWRGAARCARAAAPQAPSDVCAPRQGSDLDAEELAALLEVPVALLELLKDLRQGAGGGGLHEVLAEHLLEALRAELRHAEDVVRPLLVELLRLVGVVRRHDALRVGPDLAGDLQELRVGRALQQRVGDRGDHDPRLAVVGVLQDVRLLVVPVGALHASLPELRHDALVDVDDVDPLQDTGVARLELRDEHGGDPVEAQQQDVPLLMVVVLAVALAVAVRPAPAPDAVVRLAQEAVELGVETNQVGG
mmetsp:Transcript_71466/g.209470  ORF Transcript_71466/g.209470 Transcript_71466/m.209470 type:complete len:279 (+) Transcript_71466:75-911(+)